MLLSATQLHLMLQMLEDSGFVRIPLDSQDPNTLAVVARLNGQTFEISDLGIEKVAS